MGQRFTYDGIEYEEMADGKARIIGPAGGSQIRATPLPISPQKQREIDRDDRRDARDERGAERDDARTNIAVRGEQREVGKIGFDNARDLRTEYMKLPDVQDYRQAVKSYTTALKTAPNAAGDLNLIYSFAKIMDPGSVVREGEAAAVAGGDSIYGQTVARLRKELTDSGGAFRPEYRDQLRRELQTRVEHLNDAYNTQRIQYQTFAKELGVDPKVVIGAHDGERFRGEIDNFWIAQRKAAARGQGGYDAENGITGTVSDEAPWPSKTPNPSPTPASYGDSYLSQGMSGINEGIANTFGLPVDVFTEVMNLAPRGINAVANTDIPLIRDPIGGSQSIKNLMDGWAIGDRSDDASKQFVRRVGQSVGSALVPLAGQAGTLRGAATGLLSAAGGGVGGATAQQVFPGNPVAEFAGELAGGGLTGLARAAAIRRQSQRQIEAGIPTVDDLKQQAGELYRRAEARGVTADPEMTQDLADQLRTALADDGRVSPTGRISEVYPKAREAVRLADDYAGREMNPTQMQTVRKVMADGLNSVDATERRTARMLTDRFDQWADPQAPELSDARSISSRYLNAQQLERARELAGARAGQFSGSGYENALRTEYRTLDRNAILGKGRNGQDVDEAIQRVSRGTPMSNAAREVGKFAPRGVVSFGLGTGAPAAVGGLIFGPGGAAVAGGGALAMGEAGRMAATRMGLRNAELAELTARNGGAIEQAPLLDPETQSAINSALIGAGSNYVASLRSAPRKKGPKS